MLHVVNFVLTLKQLDKYDAGILGLCPSHLHVYSVLFIHSLIILWWQRVLPRLVRQFSITL